MKNVFIDRRTFAARVAAAALAGRSLLAAREAAGSGAPLKIGVFGLDYTFWPIWADLLSPKGKYSGTALLHMQPTHVWDKDRKKATEFAERWGCEVVDRYDGMVGKVDGIVNGDLYNVPWQHLLMRPYIEAGIPCFLQRPWADTLPHLDEMLNLAAKHTTTLLATVPFEHYNEAESVAAQLKTVGSVQAVFGAAQVTDHPHFHLPYMLMKILGYDVQSVSMIADDPKQIGYLAVNYVFPTTEKRPGFVASMHGAKPDVFRFTIVGEQGTVGASMPGSSSYFYRFITQLVDIQKAFEKRENYQPLDTIRRKFICAQAEYYSHYERGGSPVKIGSSPPRLADPGVEAGLVRRLGIPALNRLPGPPHHWA